MALQFLASRSVDGIIISVSTETSDYTHIQTLYEKGLPIVSFDRIVNFPNIHKVKLDNFEGTYKATKHLLNNGFKKISLLASAQHLSITEERIQGYIYALKEKKIKFNENLVKYCALQFLASRSVDGIIISVSTETSDYTHIQTLYEKGLPIVSFDRIVNFPNIHKVKLDNFEGTYKATKHLLNNGFKKISLLASAQHLSITEERIQGYIYALKEKKIKFNENLVKYCAHGGLIYEELESILKKILKDKNKPDAIISGSDKITTNLMRYCHKNNIKIPDSLGIIGFSNLDLTEFLTPSLSVITQPAFEMGKKACELLIKQIESKKTISVFEEIQLPTELLYRESTKKNKG